MARLARILVHGIAPPVTQRGNRSQTHSSATRITPPIAVSAPHLVQPEEWRWSSARAHVAGSTDLPGTSGPHRNRRAMLSHGLEAADMAEAEQAAIEARIRTGRPFDDEAFVGSIEQATGRTLKPQERGRKAKTMAWR